MNRFIIGGMVATLVGLALSACSSNPMSEGCIHTDINVLHCGACGHECYGGDCVKGVCQPAAFDFGGVGQLASKDDFIAAPSGLGSRGGFAAITMGRVDTYLPWVRKVPSASGVTIGPYDGISSVANEFKYDLQVNYTKLEDAFEPNNSYPLAKPISAGTAISALFAEGYRLSTPPLPEDWYTVDLPAGKISVQLTDTSDVAAQVTLYTASASSPPVPANSGVSAFAATPGEDVSLVTNFTYPTGKYFIVVHAADGTPVRNAGDGTTLPAHFTKPYRLLVTTL